MNKETELADLLARVESLEQRILVIDQPKLTVTKFSDGPIEAYTRKLRRRAS